MSVESGADRGLAGPDPIEVDLPGARVAFATRRGGVSVGPYESLNLGILTDDDPERVAENRRRLADAVGLAPERVAMGWQVHGGDLREWQEPPAPNGYAEPGAELERVDGHLTDRQGLALLVLVADCYPVALSDGRQVAMLHCGWRPLAAGILERALERLEGAVAAAVGPGIGGCCYEVGPEVLGAFAELDGVASGRMLDLRAVIARKLEAAGVSQVQHVDECTSCLPERYFSHRRDHGVTGRQAGLALLHA
ncbi:MAG: polyphenol oxidase family protein [Thermoleophilaceae bacterium]